MGKINWTINGKNFDSFGIGVSASRGFGDLLKQKDRPSYNWPGQHGKQYDLDSKPKYEERTIELDCFVIGDNWNLMTDQFRSFSSEFDKEGTQRLIVEIFSYKPRIYDVILSDKIILNEVKKEGKSAGSFTLKLTEPDPIKKILSIESSKLELAFNSSDWISVNTGYSSVFKKGDVNINESLPFEKSDEGNLILGSTEVKKYYETSAIVDENVKQYTFGADATGTGSYTLYAIARNKSTNVFEVLGRQAYTLAGPQRIGVRFSANLDLYGKLVFTLQNISNQTLPMSKVVLKTGYESFDYESNVNTHYISLAGDVDEITELTTNAEVLWNKL
ncbi:hypothetical protein ATE49_15330 [Elizabethkingia miricola]|uniref:Phage-related protein n=1 Tax=Elizabethkingia miricola TaxID=172045 RepID=A0ABY3NC41_ELIMR|nr:phage tail domain-containing protein [Elizabethkingia miricola]OBS12826.1 hypothetical protein ATE49_15330 [Elizabethkingia miricola]TYO84794.1 phage-related protein [Elizabethkingia miricola]TYO91694.1 phage-related protein [Elizabethkingia miricola]